MKEKLQNAFKPAPERFRYAVREAAREAVSLPSPSKRHISKGWRIVIAVLLIAALIPTAVIGAGKLYELIAQPVDNYGLSIGRDDMTVAKDYPAYVKMHIKVPEGFAAVPNTDDLKYYSLTADTPYTDGFSLFPMRFTDDASQKEYIGNVGSYEERMINGHQAYEVKLTVGEWSRLYIYYEDVNVLLLVYHSDVTNDQLDAFVGGISFTEGTADDCTDMFTPVDERLQGGYEYAQEFIELPRETKLTFKKHSEKTNDDSLRFTGQITGVRTVTNIADLDKACFNPGYQYDDIADSEGNLLPKTVEVIKEGDGFEHTREVLSSTEKAQSMILVDIAYENLSDEHFSPYIACGLSVLDKHSDGSFTYTDNIDGEQGIYAVSSYEPEVVYFSHHGEGKGFLTAGTELNDSLTVTIGFLCSTDMLDKAYLTLYDLNAVEKPAYHGGNSYAYYVFKVRDDA